MMRWLVMFSTNTARMPSALICLMSAATPRLLAAASVLMPCGEWNTTPEMAGRGRLCRADAVCAVPEERLGLGSLELPGQRPHRHERGRPDPHAWQDVQNVKLYVANIRDALIGIDPAGAADYQARATAYLAELDELDAEIKKAFEAIPKARRKAITSHDAFTYFGDAYGVVFHSPQGISTDAAASSRGVAALIKQIKAEGIRAVFVENMTNQRIIEQIAKETGVNIGGTLYYDALSSGPPADTYIDLMRHNTRLLAAAMQ